MATSQHRQKREPPPPPPETGSIVKGKVSKIESYGAFVSILMPSSASSFCHRGLLHISQLSSNKVNSVEDCLDLDDEIYVKVLHCEEEEDTRQRENLLLDDERDEFGDPQRRRREWGRDKRKRFKISLSMKYASQDGSYTDLDPNNEQYHNESKGKRGGGEGRNSSIAPVSNAPSTLETSLNSQIGMGMAIDPLAAMQQGSSSNRLILRDNNPSSSTSGGKKKVVINGYELVDDYEGEVDVPPPQSHGNVVTDQGTAKRPLGRGRGSTLPAWMTQSSSNNDTILSKRDDRSHSSSSSTDHHRKRKKKHRKKDDKKKKRKRKHHKYDDDYSDEEKEKKSSRRKHHHKRHKSKSENGSLSRSRSRSRGRDKKQNEDDDRHYSRKRGHRATKSGSKFKHRHRRKNGYSSSEDDGRRSRSASQNSHGGKRKESSSEIRGSKSDSEPMFKSIDEAKELIKKLESKR